MEGDETWPETVPGTAQPMPRASALTLDRFRVDGVLGRGGMGEVMSARDERIGRSVAIKRLHDGATDAQAAARFLREIRIQGRLEHPAVVPVHELGYDADGHPFLVMKQVAGITLGAVLRKLAAGEREAVEQFSRQRLLRAFAEVCLAVEFAHTRGVVHRDLKPANVILGDFGEVYVLDWGIAHVMSEHPRAVDLADVDTLTRPEATVEGAIIGTPGYMSPEQIRNEPDLDARSDVYALGCLLFEILALEPLHERGLAGIALALTGIEARPSKRAPRLEIPPELDEICATATRTDRGERYATARALGDAVQRYLDGDRDLAMRRELATSELARARDALASGTSPQARREALTSAARALALDPTYRQPAELVARLMLEPPRETPPEVIAAVERADDDALYAARRLIVLASLAYLAFIPVLFLVGFRDPVFLGLAVAVVGAMTGLGLTIPRSRVHAVAWVGLVGNSLMTMLFAWAASPYIIAPSLAVVTAMSMTHPRATRPWLVVAVCATSVMLPIVLELGGVLPESTTFGGGRIVLQTLATDLDPAIAHAGFSLYVVALIAMGVVFARTLSRDRRAAQRRIELQSWHLRQLVPD